MMQNTLTDDTQRLILENFGLVHSSARRFRGRGAEYDDLCQIGAIGLIKAAKRFDKSRGLCFSTYAVPLIMGEIRRFLRDDGIIKVSRKLKENAVHAGICAGQLREKLGREPTLSELSNESGIPPEELTASLDASRPPQSIYEETAEDMPLLDKIAINTDDEEMLARRISLFEAIKKESGEARLLIYYRFFRDKTQSETARIIGRNQVYVSRLEKKIMARLREEME